MGMSPLAAFLRDSGAAVCGFDDHPDAVVANYLEKYGVETAPSPFARIGKNPRDNSDLSGYDTVVISTALRPLREKFESLGAKNIMLRGECWAQICKKRRLSAVVGSHGKSTVSAMSAHAINKYGLGGGWLVGAVPAKFDMHKFAPGGGIVVSEIDESDGTIENFSPEITAALNADLDHTDTYADWDALKNMFRRLFGRTKKTVLFPKSDPILREIAREFPQKARPVEIPQNDFNAANAALARAVVEETFAVKLPADAFDDFAGLRRRQERIYADSSAVVVADYAHHPSEVAAFLKLFNTRFSDRRRITVFQPHRYTRTKKFAQNFAEILAQSAATGNETFLAQVYAASEPFDPDGTSEKIIEFAPANALKLAKDDEPFRVVRDNSAKGEKLALAVVGAGDIYFAARKFFGDADPR